MQTSLPIDRFLPEIVDTIARHPITLLEAEAGAGKTTRVPAALLAKGFEPIYVLEPRRLAARLAASRVAFERHEELGQTVGCRVRFEDHSSNNTKLWYMTEGTFVRMLLGRNGVRGACVVVLDEFHERHLETDSAFALLRQSQQTNRELRLVMMSATLAGDNLRAKIGDPPLIRVPGKMFPVSVHYTPSSAVSLDEQVRGAVENALQQTPGHVLVFLPGSAEIRRAIHTCTALGQRNNAEIMPLYGDLSFEEQQRAIAPSQRRKIICSTNIAESSITIEGVTAVIDSGLARLNTHSPWSGFPRVEVRRISRSSALQRAGRAGRTAPGMAIRLYSETEFVRRPEQLEPEVLRTELSELVLLLSAHGRPAENLPWLDNPPVAALAEASTLLSRLGALNGNGAITTLGQRMARLPLHPRLACFVLQATEIGTREVACDLAARLSENRVLRNESISSDIESVLDSDPTYAARRLRTRLLRETEAPSRQITPDSYAIEKAFLLAYPDRVARRRGTTLQLSNNRSVRLDKRLHIAGDYLLAIEIDDRTDQTTPMVRLAVAIKPDWVLDFFPERIVTREEIVWNRGAERVEQVNALLYEQLAIDKSFAPPSQPARASELLLSKALEAGIENFTDEQELDRFLRRIRFAGHYGIVVPSDLVDTGLAKLAEGLTSFSQLQAATANGALLAVLQRDLPMHRINQLAPTHLLLPSGRRAPIDYHDDRPPSVASRLQDFFGLQETPVIVNGSVPVTIELLAPNRRPIQVTTDLSSFWKTLYPQLRPQLSRRYPKHAWPERPM